ncbi:MAG: hypothetical protein K2J10_09185 [Muribaculaceae bacterium]|nr:hypothetical protein [Muribaculaceae bacterium]
MMKTRALLFCLFAFAASTFAYASDFMSQADSIRTALCYQREHYPASQYRDVYKNFMQDFFGPGHILADTVAAGRYLRKELSETDVFDGPLFEPTGFRGNFYRVNLSVLKDGIVPYDVFFDAFVSSVQGVTPPDAAYWMNLWQKIDNEISILGWKFQNEQSDRTELSAQFSEGNYIVHHSKAYNEAVNFHYRIISKANFERYIRPYLFSD